MRVSEVLHAGVEQFLELTPSIKEHLETAGNPHHLTKESIGLGNVSNVLQAKESDFRTHKEAKTLDHPDKSVTTAKLCDGAVTGAKLASQAVTETKLAAASVGSGIIKNESVLSQHLSMSLRNTINGKIDRQEGMGLSQNSFTDEEKGKLAAIRVTDGTADIDLPSLVSRNTPLKIRKTGQDFEEADSDISFTGVSKLECFDVLPTGKDAAFGYRNTSGNFVSAFYKDGKFRCKYEAGTGAGHCTMSVNDYLAAEAKDGILTIYAASRTTTVPRFSEWFTCSLSVSGELHLRHIFPRWDYKRSQWEITVIYTPVNYNYLYIDCFIMQSSTVTLKWQKKLSLYSRVSSSHGDLLYDTRFRMACMDGNGVVYVAPMHCTTEPYAVLAIDRDGEIINRYREAFSNTSERYVMRDLILCGNYLYGYTATGITRIDIITGTQTSLYETGSSSRWKLRGLMMLPDGHLAFCGIYSQTGRAHLLLFCTEDDPRYSLGEEFFLDKELMDTTEYCVSINVFAPEILAIYLDGETNTLTTKRLLGYDVYSVL